jgi:hypothetical protein
LKLQLLFFFRISFIPPLAERWRCMQQTNDENDKTHCSCRLIQPSVLLPSSRRSSRGIRESLRCRVQVYWSGSSECPVGACSYRLDPLLLPTRLVGSKKNQEENKKKKVYKLAPTANMLTKQRHRPAAAAAAAAATNLSGSPVVAGCRQLSVHSRSPHRAGCSFMQRAFVCYC